MEADRSALTGVTEAVVEEVKNTTLNTEPPTTIKNEATVVVAAAPVEPKKEPESDKDGLKEKLDNIADAIVKMEKATAGDAPKIKPMEPFARTISAIRECHSWDEFKNHHSSDEHCHAIETLVAGESLKTEIEEAAAHGGDEDPFFFGGYSGGHSRGYFGRRRLRQAATVVDDGDEVWLQHVRINSKVIMGYLGLQSSAGKKWKGRPHVFQRPFRYLIYFHDKMKKILADLEEANVSSAPGTSSNGHSNSQEAVAGVSKAESDSLGLDTLFAETEAELTDMRLYVKLVDEKIMPDYHRFDGKGPDLPDKIRWDDLWYLFRPNDILYAPPSFTNRGTPTRFPLSWAGFLQSAVQGGFADADADIASSGASRNATRASHTDQMIWKVYRPPHKSTGGGCSCEECIRGVTSWTVCCYHIDYDGQGYRAVSRDITIPTFNGERDITQLPCYPIRYVKKMDEIMEAGRNNGRKFIQHIDPAQRYAFHRGWTIIKTPRGQGIKDKNGRLFTSPEHIESEILVDFEEAFNTDPTWRPEFLALEEESHHVLVAMDHGNPLREWDDEKRAKLKDIWEDRLVYDDSIDILQQNELIETDQLLNPKRVAGVDGLDGDDLALLPRRLFAYALWERKFVQVDARDVQAPDFKDKDRAFENLEIPAEHKTLIKSLVYSHFQRRMNEGSVEIASQDIIRGKGKGIVILLFGVPGVGKTATAEAVAQKFEKPLFPITCGDLGFTPQSVESSLTEIFRLAHLWDCVLLLDEADVFITQRNKTDLERNALVSVFLRMLEYYNGILFLTTNRPGVLDEAVKSRVHLNLRYNFLTEEQVVAIFRLNIIRLREIEEQASRAPGHKRLYIDEKDIIEFAGEHWRNNTDGIGRWNGRQIRNAFLIAASLAHYEGDLGERPEGLQKQLTSKHFKKVEETTKRYDEYRVSCLGHTDSYIAHDRYERDDDWAPVMQQQQHRAGSFAHPYPETQYPPGPGYLVRQGSKPWQRPGPGGGVNHTSPYMNSGYPPPHAEYTGVGSQGAGAGSYQPRQGASYNTSSTPGPVGAPGSYDATVNGLNPQARGGTDPGMSDNWNGGGQAPHQHWGQDGFKQY